MYKIVLTLPNGQVKHVSMQTYTSMKGKNRFKSKARLVHVREDDPAPNLTVIEGGGGEEAEGS